jgi:hypothetical protein
MRKNFLMVGAMLVAGTFLGADVAKAADVQMGGSVMTRYELLGRDFNDATQLDGQIGARVRLEAKANIDEKTSAFIQLQSVGVFGDTAATTPTNTNANGGARGGAAASDTLSDVGAHQAYFTLKNFYDMPVDVQVGRQEVILDGHRLLGNTIWTLGMQSHDAIRLNHSHGDHTLAYIYSALQEGGTDAGNNKLDQSAHIFWGNFKGIGGGALSLYYVLHTSDDNTFNAASAFDDNTFSTVGFRQAGTMAGFDYRGEFYYQFGGADGSAAQQTLNAGSWDREAYMVGARIGRQVGPVHLTLWYDYLSGTDADDVNSRTVGSFDTLFDTGHKFYGLMDNFLNIGLTSRGGAAASVRTDSVRGLGLQDLALKGVMKVGSAWTVNADLHMFWTAVDARSSTSGVDAATTNIGRNDGESHLGEELDLSLSHKYSANTSIVFGYSHFFADDLGSELLGPSTLTTASQTQDDADWAYIMVNVGF